MATPSRLSNRESIEILEATIANGSCRLSHPQLIEKLCQLLPGDKPIWDDKRNRWKLADGYEERPLPPEDCLAPPGPGKVNTMVERYENGQAIMVPPILFFDQHGHYLGCRGDSICAPKDVGNLMARSLADRHWNGSVILLGYKVLGRIPTELELTKQQEIEKRRKIERRQRCREDRKRAALEQIAEAAMKRPHAKGPNYFLLLERIELMKKRKEVIRARPQEAMAAQACPTCAAPIGERCKGGRIHKLRRKQEVIEVEKPERRPLRKPNEQS